MLDSVLFTTRMSKEYSRAFWAIWPTARPAASERSGGPGPMPPCKSPQDPVPRRTRDYGRAQDADLRLRDKLQIIKGESCDEQGDRESDAGQEPDPGQVAPADPPGKGPEHQP